MVDFLGGKGGKDTTSTRSRSRGSESVRRGRRCAFMVIGFLEDPGLLLSRVFFTPLFVAAVRETVDFGLEGDFPGTLEVDGGPDGQSFELGKDDRTR